MGDKMKLRQLTLFILFLFFPFLSYAETIEKFQLSRPDGSILTGYVTCPENRDSFPIAMIAHGSPCESIWSWHEDFNAIAMHLGAALVTLEKQGIYSPYEIDVIEYDQTNTIHHRLADHLYFIEKLREGKVIPQWNGRLIMIGGSEGGRVAAAVSAQTPEVKATALFTCGGGLTTLDELTIAFTKYMQSHGESEQEIAETLGFLDLQVHAMLINPTPEKKFMEYTYKWWVSHLNRHPITDILQINHPLYYAHGTEDAVVPIESADNVAEQLRGLGKSDFYYHRIEGCGHDMRTFPPHVVVDMMQMLEDNRPHLFP
jgi:pimeloyl-ACP methyl ester carboxylesterase